MINKELYGRKVQAFRHTQNAKGFQQVDEGSTSLLIGFGTAFSHHTGGQYTTAIVEYPDGGVREYPIEDIRFLS